MLVRPVALVAMRIAVWRREAPNRSGGTVNRPLSLTGTTNGAPPSKRIVTAATGARLSNAQPTTAFGSAFAMGIDRSINIRTGPRSSPTRLNTDIAQSPTARPTARPSLLSCGKWMPP